MARPLRVEYPGAVYHVMARGHERSPIFRDDRDRKKFLELVGTTVQDLGIEVHGYCLMDNHYHLLVETPEGGLSRAMKAIGERYSQWFNWRHKRSGPATGAGATSGRPRGEVPRRRGWRSIGRSPEARS
jgi:putative transposase